MSFDLPGNEMVGLPRDVVIALRSVLFAQAGANAATYLYDAGYAGGQPLHDAFVRWCRAHKLSVPENMDAPEFEKHASAFLGELGLGAVKVGTLHDAVITVDSTNWAEAEPASAMQFPGCYLSVGMLTHFFTRLGGEPVAVMEVECRSMGSARCRFLVGSAETVQQVYDAIAQGAAYDTALQPTA